MLISAKCFLCSLYAVVGSYRVCQSICPAAMGINLTKLTENGNIKHKGGIKCFLINFSRSLSQWFLGTKLKNTFVVAETAVLSITELQLRTVKPLSVGSDAKISTASLMCIQRFRLVSCHVAMIVQYTVLNKNLTSQRSIYIYNVLRCKLCSE